MLSFRQLQDATGLAVDRLLAFVEILLVTTTSGAGNTIWNIRRGQQSTTPAAAITGAAVTRSRDQDLESAVIAAVAANGHSSTDAPLANDVTAVILKGLRLPFSNTATTLLGVLADPSPLKLLLNASGTITIGGSPAAGDKLTATFQAMGGVTWSVDYTLTAADSGSVAQTASNFAQAINASGAVNNANPQWRVLAPCTVSGAVITLTAPTRSAEPLYDCTAQITASPAISVSSVSNETTGTITISGSPATGERLQTVLTGGDRTVTVSYTLTAAASGSTAQIASEFANAINRSPAVIGPAKFPGAMHRFRCGDHTRGAQRHW